MISGFKTHDSRLTIHVSRLTSITIKLKKMIYMSAQRRRFSLEEKLEILQQAKQSGITAVLRRHNLSYSVFHRWKEKLTEKGKEEEVRSAHNQVNTKLKE